ncbi:GntR family transcriptional regulator [Agrobacterium sp. SOY23]|uniref:GntR family transcriptional regulator n=1 Tax=Agrobacterium sp. SOY23 TaxID=3014555 RepID=UPI0022AFD50E|nr:GntR family transcriptional regulator [Agrobacterium sp. SOY23]MCZ4432295.1 GntR family transcriptional regulator [Agrobacterium sp. SOY23]
MSKEEANAGRSLQDKSDLTGFLNGVTITRNMPLRDQIYQLVRRAIVTGRLAPGSPVNEIEIAERLGTSRTPVREAVKRVEDEGLIDVRAQAGTFVRPISRGQVQEAYIIRIALERESVRRAAETISADAVQRLRDIIDLHALSVKRGRFEDAIDHDDAFHRVIAEVNGYSMLWRVVDITKAQMDRCRLLSLPSPGAGETTIEQHSAIVDALEAHDPEAAERAIKEHLETSLSNTLKLLGSIEASGLAGV